MCCQRFDASEEHRNAKRCLTFAFFLLPWSKPRESQIAFQTTNPGGPRLWHSGANRLSVVRRLRSLCRGHRSQCEEASNATVCVSASAHG